MTITATTTTCSARRPSVGFKDEHISIIEVDSDPDAKRARGAAMIDLLDSPDSIMAHVDDISLIPCVALPPALSPNVWLKLPRVRHQLVPCLLVLCISLKAFDGFTVALAALPAMSDFVSHTVAATALAGFVAQLVDGALGMGYGLTSSTVLVAAGLSPKTASASVHLAQLGTTLVSGLAHNRCGTVHWPTTRGVALPGVGGAFAGAILLASLDAKAAKTIASGLLLLVGMYLLYHFYKNGPCAEGGGGEVAQATPRKAVLLPIGALGGFVDATGGGGWGPVATSGLLAEGSLPPSRVIGTVSMSEFFVTVAAVAGFGVTSLLGQSHGAANEHGASVRLDLMLALLAGGLVAAPIAPRLVTRLRPKLLGVLVGTFICFTNARVLLPALGASEAARMGVYAVLTLWGGFAIARVARQPDGA